MFQSKKCNNIKIVAFGCILIGACTHDIPVVEPVSIQIELPPKEAEQPKKVAIPESEPAPQVQAQLQKFDETLAKDERLKALMFDVRLILKAQLAEENGFYEEAENAWQQAVLAATDGFSEYAFRNWVKAQLKTLKQSPADDVLAELILSKTNNGNASQYLLKKGLTRKTKLRTWLIENFPDDVSYVKEELATETNRLGPPSTAIPSFDPLLTVTASDYCSDPKRDSLAWQKWQESLGYKQKMYFQGLVYICLGQPKKAMVTFKSIHQALISTKETAHLALNAGKEIIKLGRSLGDRNSMADAYLEVSKLWSQENVNPKDVKLTDIEAEIVRANDFIWTARYRALIGDYENAKIYAQKGLDSIARSFASVSSRRMMARHRNELVELKAEAYHVLAFRIALEKGEYDSALAFYDTGLRISGLPQKWRHTFLWYKGLFLYLKNDFSLAFNTWKGLLDENIEDSMRARLYFWIAQAASKQNYNEGKYYAQKLVNEFPLNFYSVIGLQVAGYYDDLKWTDLFMDRKELIEDLRNPRKLNVQDIRAKKELGRLLMRAEILLNLGFADLAKIAVTDYGRKLQGEYSLAKIPEAFIYLTRLYSAVDMKIESISLNNELSNNIDGYWKDWPEQAYVYFPQPYLDIFKRNSLDTGIETEIMLGIARQESAFKADAGSHVGALGLMQVMPATAKPLSISYGIGNGENIRQKLLEPDFNIAVGGRYLERLRRRYRSYLPAIFAAYNAGEYSVDAWLKRRYHENSLLWIEMVPFLETRNYIKKTWRNYFVYKLLYRTSDTKLITKEDLSYSPFESSFAH